MIVHCLGLLVNVVLGIPPIGDGPSVTNHLGSEVVGANVAFRDETTVPIPRADFAGHPVVPDLVGQGEGGVLATAPRLPTSRAGLPLLGCVDAVEADPFTGKLDGVAVDDEGFAHDIGMGWLSYTEEDGGNTLR